jgi:serine/threonine protein kinase
MIMKGQKISDRYQIIKSIGEGGMANVYLAYDTILDRNVAVKVLRGDLANDEKFVRRFQREALSASSLSNPNIVEVYDVGEDNGEYYIVMEYVEGKHLKALLKKRGKLTVPEVIDIALQITNGLSVAHDSYIIHRDIKPQNILILENGLIKITDFGIAVAMNATQLTQTNSVMGSVHYLPPEQASGKGATLQSDIYSIGILMYELLTGKLPFRGDNAVEIALKHLKEPMPSIRDELPDIPQSVENIILRATAKNPKNRYSDAREMHEDLKTCLDESRANELKITFKYPENDYDDTKLMKTVKPVKETKPKEIKEGEKEVAKKKKSTDNSQNKLLITLASVFVGLVVVITTIFVLIPKITSSKQTAIPDVSGYSVTDAIKALQDAGFVVSDEQREEANENVEEGKVSRTSPAIGRRNRSHNLSFTRRCYNCD